MPTAVPANPICRNNNTMVTTAGGSTMPLMAAA
jgi:hypothetical protein